MESRDMLRAEIAFVVHVMKPLYSAITVLQKESGGIVNGMGVFHRCNDPHGTM